VVKPGELSALAEDVRKKTRLDVGK
jgi:hypothetical protein